MTPLGSPLPSSSTHAVSVSLPQWKDVIDYEEGRIKLNTGYPRFVFHYLIRNLIMSFNLNEECLVFSSMKYASECLLFIRGGRIVVKECGLVMLYVVVFSSEYAHVAKQFWQHSGLGVSSRLAEYCLSVRSGGSSIGTSSNNNNPHIALRQRLAHLYATTPDRILLFPSGMAAIYSLYRSIGKTTIQFGMPYLDTIKIQQKWGKCIFIPSGDINELQDVLECNNENVDALFCEFPTNPLLHVPDLKRIWALGRKYKFKVVVDDTISGPLNVNIREYCDFIVSSLTKAFSGSGDVMAGCIVCTSAAASANEIELYEENGLFYEDAVVLERNSRDYEERVRKMNVNAELLVSYLSTHEKVKRVYYPSSDYDEYKVEGRGPLFSLLLKTEEEAIKFYDVVQIEKGPSLGTNFTLCCPYTLLAHYNELEEVEGYGLKKWLIRVSVGLEDGEELIEKFRVALSNI